MSSATAVSAKTDNFIIAGDQALDGLRFALEHGLDGGQLLERQAIRRLEGGTLTPDETEAVGVALMRLEETVRDLAARFGLEPDDLNLDLGPLGRLL